MKIAIHAADLDDERIDGTRIYIFNMLKYFGSITPENDFKLYHRKSFNQTLLPPDFENYSVSKTNSPFLWTQTRFAWELLRDKPNVLWMPVHNLPILKSTKLKIIVTVHDLAFKYFPSHFPKKDLRKLNFLANLSIKRAAKIIAVSQSTKNDILKFFPKISADKIKVIHHGFDAQLFSKKIDEDFSDQILKSYKLKDKNYLLYVGAIQPRKNLITLVEAFEKIFEKDKDLKLVIAGKKAWMWKPIIDRIEKSPAQKNIILLGAVPFEHLPILFQSAKLFVFPEMYAGFGIPILEAFASGTPVLAARNSSLTEVGGDAAQYFETMSKDDLAKKITLILSDDKMCLEMIEKGLFRIKEFSWEKCARETLEFILE